MKRPLLAAVALLGVSATGAAVPTPAPSRPRPSSRPAAPPARKPPLDFSGTWELDEKGSRAIAPAMAGAVITVQQKGDRIWIAPENAVDSKLLAEMIVADGRPYVKSLGNKGKGTVTVGWASDGKSLWIEVAAGPEESPRSILQRSVWKLSENRSVWVRQTVTIQNEKVQESRLVFRRREKAPG